MTSNSASRPIASDVDVNPDAGVAMTFPTYATAPAQTPPTTTTNINFRRIFTLLVCIRPSPEPAPTINQPAARLKR
jgi:hypothetical protein